jgi:hypothetical protein
VPQFFGSVLVLTQAADAPSPHFWSGVLQKSEQLPLSQTSPEPHALPQTPQFSRSLVVSMQVVPQAVCVELHAGDVSALVSPPVSSVVAVPLELPPHPEAAASNKALAKIAIFIGCFHPFEESDLAVQSVHNQKNMRQMEWLRPPGMRAVKLQQPPPTWAEP